MGRYWDTDAIVAHYQICVFGKPGAQLDELKSRLARACSDLGLSSNTVSYVPEAEVAGRETRLPVLGVFFGYPGATDEAHSAIELLIAESSTIITVVSNIENARAELPPCLEHVNALELGGHAPRYDRLVTLVLESFRLLRRERRLFISYKRLDSQSVADKLYDELDQRGFDVFIDTRSVPPAVDFQDELWHRLADTDVVVLIDTPNFRASRWTTEELAQANATNIQILHLLWPGQSPDPESAFSEFYPLKEDDFVTGPSLGGVSTIRADALNAICDAVERLRARALAARYRYLVDNFCDVARTKGLAPDVQPDRWISIPLPSGGDLAVVPTIGVPTSNRINEVFDAIAQLRSEKCTTWLLYDNRGLLTSWLSHLEWLDRHLPAKTVRVARASEALERVVAC